MTRRGWVALGTICAASALALFVFLLALGEIDLDEPREPLCPQANALRTARMLDKAGETYASAGKAGEKCAGLKKLEATQAQAEEHFATAGLYASAAATSKLAIDEFAAGLALNPFESKASLGLTLELKKGLAPLQAQCETAANLVEDGLLTVAGVALARGLGQQDSECEETVVALGEQRTEATTYLHEARTAGDKATQRSKYGDSLSANANLAAAKAGLEASLNDESCLDAAGSWFAGVPDTLKRALDWFVPLAIGLLVLTLVLWIAIREAAARFVLMRKLFQWLGELPGLSFLYKAAVPEISIEDFTGKGEGDLEGAYFSTLLAAEMTKQGDRAGAFPFDRINKGREEGDVLAISEAVAEVEATKLLGGLIKILSRLFRRRTVRLQGRLAPIADEGAGVLLSVEGNGLEGRNVALWERDYDPKRGGKGAARWLRLAPAATVWARWQLARAYAHPKGIDTVWWRSDAAFKTAQAWQAQGDFGRAETLYVEALERDPGLLPALHNLSVLAIHRGEYALAREQIAALRAVLEEGGPEEMTPAKLKKLWPTLDTASLYTLVLALAYPEIDPNPKAGDGDLKQAIANARTLVSELARELTRTDAEKEEDEGEASEEDALTVERLAIAESPSVVLLASISVRDEEEGKEEEAAAERRAAVEHAVAETGAAKETVKVTRLQLRDNTDTLKPWQLIHGYVLNQRNVSRRTHYNLACYFTTLLAYADEDQKPRCQERALKSLDAALVGGGLVGWAAEDPSLTPLKEAGTKKFEDILEEHTIKPHSDQEEPAKPDKSPKPPPDEERKSIVALLTQIRDEMRKRANE